MPFIVSANYRDRSSPLKWLVRREDQHMGDARPCNKVYAKGVKFVKSSEAEEGFGCKKVAVCDEVQYSYDDAEVLRPAATVPLHYYIGFMIDFFWSARKLPSAEITSVQELYLGADGKMEAVLVEAVLVEETAA